MARKEKPAPEQQGDPAEVVQAVVLLDCSVNGVRLKLGQIALGPRAMVQAHAGMLDPHEDAVARAQGVVVVDLTPPQAAPQE